MKKAQLQINETIVILFVFFIILAIGLAFFSAMARYGIENNIEENRQQDLVKLLQTVVGLPEFKCTSQGNEKSACVDLYKVRAFEQLISNTNNPTLENYYANILGFSVIELEQLYPTRQTYPIYSNPGEQDNGDSVFIPVSINDPVEGEVYYFGLLTIKKYY